MYLKEEVSCPPDVDELLSGAGEPWRFNLFESAAITSVLLPAIFDAVSGYVSPGTMNRDVRITADPEDLIAWLRVDMRFGFEQRSIHDVNIHQRRFIEFCGEEILPELSREEALYDTAVQADL